MRTKSEVAKLRLRVVALWNARTGTYTEIGSMVGETRNAVGRLLSEARAAGIHVRDAGTPQTEQRAGQKSAMQAARKTTRNRKARAVTYSTGTRKSDPA